MSGQSAENDAPVCWRSECRTGCYYPQVCSEQPRVVPPEVTHCANCGAKVPVDRAHKVGECDIPPA
jgi:hypothetical protein